MSLPITPAAAFVARRRALAARFPRPALLTAGLPRTRNYRADQYRFRAASHFLYLVGEHIPGAALLLAEGKTTLFVEPPDADDALWHGPRPSLDDVRTQHAVDAVLPLSAIDDALQAAGGPAAIAALRPQDTATAAWLTDRLGRPITANTSHELPEASPDLALADALLALRLQHDEAAITQLRAAAEASAAAHLVGMRATRSAAHEWEVMAAMIGELYRRKLGESYQPIVSVHGEVLHSHTYDNALTGGDLLLADVGGEVPEGWCADITRTWPVSGKFSPTQRAIYDVVLAAQEQAVAMVRKGTRYRDIHLAAGRAMVTGLRDLGIFRGDVDGLLERGAAAIFFPHGIGHLIGLDVHDMEDLWDRAGYAPGRARSTRFGDKFLRLDRDLSPGMAVTIEPGFYNVPAILADARIVGAVGDDLNRDVLARFSDVRGIRIEDDVVCTEGEPEVLTRSVPKRAVEIEAVMAEARA